MKLGIGRFILAAVAVAALLFFFDAPSGARALEGLALFVVIAIVLATWPMRSLARAQRLHASGRHAESLELVRKHLRLTETLIGSNDPGERASAQGLAFLALVLSDLGRSEEAEEPIARSLAIAARRPGSVRAMRIKNYVSIARLRQKRLDEAQALARECLANAETRPARKLDRVVALMNLGIILARNARAAEGESVCRWALELAATLRSPAIVSRSRACLAECLKELGKLDEARSLAEQAIVESDASVGPDHPLGASIRLLLAEIAGAQARHEEAEKLAVEVVGRFERVYGPEHPEAARARATRDRLLAHR